MKFHRVRRRQALGLVGCAAIGLATFPTRAFSQGLSMRRFDPFELQTSATDLLALCDGLAGFAIESVGPSPSMVWIKGANNEVRAVGVDQRDLEFKFEVFTLAIETQAALVHRVETAPPVQLPDDAPEMLRQIAAMPRAVPTPPNDFEPWPLSSWRLDVLRRAEYIVGDLQPPPATFGDNPVAQNAAKPDEVPPEAWAVCDVAAGLLFTDNGNGRRFLIGVDWFPFNLVVTQDESEIREYVEPCEAVAVADYVQRLA